GTFSIYLHMIADYVYFFFSDWGVPFSEKIATIRTYHDTGYHWTLSHGQILLVNRVLQALFGTALIYTTFLVADYCFKGISNN
ncbi:MAG: hypothetical protein OXE99_08555, partial [Cellvibrionales bacterium]|nr:hypothetical protein [Cellvibrionales bacterium]